VKEDSLIARERSPRIRIAHWFLLTAVCASVAAVRTIWDGWFLFSGPSRQYNFVVNLFVALLVGTSITGALITFWQRPNEAHPKRAPGHWLLLYVGLLYGWLGGFNFVMAAIDGVAPRAFSLSEFELWHAQTLFLYLGAALVSFLAAWGIKGSWWWKGQPLTAGIALMTMVPQHFLVSFGYWYSFVTLGMWPQWLYIHAPYVEVALGVMVIGLLLMALRHDRRHQIERDWLHWLGVGVFFIAGVGGIAEGIYYWNV
jgi:hypothetical protein